jgi:hypothetical protein
MGKYRNMVDLMGHAHLGGKTLVYFIGGLYPGVHPRDNAPRKLSTAPFNGTWAASLLASQDPVDRLRRSGAANQRWRRPEGSILR